MFTNPTIGVGVAGAEVDVRLADPVPLELVRELTRLASPTTLTAKFPPTTKLSSLLPLDFVPSNARFLAVVPSSRYLPSTRAFSRIAHAFTDELSRLLRRFGPNGRLNVEADPNGPDGREGVGWAGVAGGEVETVGGLGEARAGNAKRVMARSVRSGDGRPVARD